MGSREDATQVAPQARAELAPVSFWYIVALTTFSVGTCAITMCSNQVLPITLRKLTDSTSLIGFIVALQALNQIWVTPWAAWKSDRIWTRIGRRKPFVLIMTPILALSVILVPHISAIWLIVFLVFILQMAEDAQLALMMPAISDSVPDRQRPMATGMWQLMQAIPIILIGRYVMKLMDPGQHEYTIPGVNLHFSITGAEHWPYTIAGITVVLTGLVFLKAMRERYVPPRPQDKFRLFSYGREIFKIREHYLIYIVCFFQPLFVLVASSFSMLLATKTLHMLPSEYGKAFSWGATTTLLVCIPFGWVFNRFRHRLGFSIVGCLLAVVSITWGLFLTKDAFSLAIFFALQNGLMFNFLRLNFVPLCMEYPTPKSVGTIMGFTQAVNGIVRFTMFPLAGWLVDLSGKNYRLPMWGGYLGIIICVAALLAMRPAEKVRHLLED